MTKKAHINTATRTTVIARDGHCVTCGTWDARDMGHIVAECNGGSNEADNLVLMCNCCNTTLGSATLQIETRAPYREARADIEKARVGFAKWARSARGAKRIKPYRDGMFT